MQSNNFFISYFYFQDKSQQILKKNIIKNIDDINKALLTIKDKYIKYLYLHKYLHGDDYNDNDMIIYNYDKNHNIFVSNNDKILIQHNVASHIDSILY
ncbi:hypothetical protein Catovirus_1_70 [Catovirus CTV1]|uniref:Uncharacterized protein n=1 Tax=Catovirus CTV1 TaxID=1977631 RepID=A0A1V0S8I7_9VIRU|nr:hypothetical protein Catovirus_1_70 [Catovirus CTV1]